MNNPSLLIILIIYIPEITDTDPCTGNIPSYVPGKPPPPTCNEKCDAKYGKQKNGDCEPALNNCGCEYDGGDCCDPDASTDRCGTGDELIDECKCKDPVACQKYPFLCGSSTPSGPPAGPPAGPCDGSCENDGYKNDGYCDDGNNNCGCDYDGGDCCGPNANKDYCDDCKCKQ